MPKQSTNKTVQKVCHVNDTTTSNSAARNSVGWMSRSPRRRKEPSTTPPLHSICAMTPTLFRSFKKWKGGKSALSMRITTPSTSTSTFRRYRTSATTKRQSKSRAHSRQTRAYKYVMTVSGHTNYIVS